MLNLLIAGRMESLTRILIILIDFRGKAFSSGNFIYLTNWIISRNLRNYAVFKLFNKFKS